MFSFSQAILERNPKLLLDLPPEKGEPFLKALVQDCQQEEERLAKQLAANDPERGLSDQQKLDRARSVARELVLEQVQNL